MRVDGHSGIPSGVIHSLSPWSSPPRGTTPSPGGVGYLGGPRTCQARGQSGSGPGGWPGPALPLGGRDGVAHPARTRRIGEAGASEARLADPSAPVSSMAWYSSNIETLSLAVGHEVVTESLGQGIIG